MAKKKTKKRHVAAKPKNKATASAQPAVKPTHSESNGKSLAPQSRVPAVAAMDRSDYARQDVRRIGLLGGGFIVFMLAIWAIFNFTGIGDQIYGLIKV